MIKKSAVNFLLLTENTLMLDTTTEVEGRSIFIVPKVDDRCKNKIK